MAISDKILNLRKENGLSQEAFAAGKNAAEYILNTAAAESINIPLKTDGKIRYTVPQVITQKKDLAVYFRVADVYRDVTIHVYDENRNEIYKKRKLKVAPGEMEKLTIKQELLETISGEITVSLEEV